MKKTINALVCALIATLAFAQTGTTTTKQATTGSGTVRYVNKGGKQINEQQIKPGTRIHVYYDGTGETPVVNRVVVDQGKAKTTRKLKAAGS